MKGFFSFSPKVEQLGTYYTISGISIRDFEADLKNNFGTTVIFSKMVKKLSSRSFKIHQFFMVEFAWILDHLTGQKNKRTVDRYRVGMLKYKQLYDEVKNKTWIASTFQAWPPYDVEKAIKHFIYKPYDDQREFLVDYARIKNGYQLRGCLLDAAVGSGKSLTSLMWSKMISDGKLVVVVPKGLVFSPWIAEINKVYKNPPKVWTSLDGTDPLNHTDAEIFIIHKEQIRTGFWDNLIDVISNSGRAPIKVVVDESHNYNEHTSQQAKGLIEFCSHKWVSDVLFMSGTPIKAQGRETFALFKVIDKFFTPDVQTDFLKLYGRDNSYLNEMLAHRLGRIKFTISVITEMSTPPEPVVIKVKFPGAERFTLNAIRAEMMHFISERVAHYRNLMPQYEGDWREIVRRYREFAYDDPKALAELARYEEIVKKFQTHGYNTFTDAELSKFASKVESDIESLLKGDELKYFRHIKSAVKYVGLKIRGEALGKVLGRARIEAVRETIRHAELPKYISAVKKKTLVYTSHIDVIKELTEYFKEEGIVSTSVYGDNSNEIDKIVNEFASSEEINPLITTYSTLREGRPMLMANQILMMNAPFRSFEQTQTIARIYRRGQDEECFVYLFDLDTGSEENITSRSIDIMEWSKEQVEVLLGGGKLPNAQGIAGHNLRAIGGFEERDYVWDIPSVQPELEVMSEEADRVIPVCKKQLRPMDLF